MFTFQPNIQFSNPSFQKIFSQLRIFSTLQHSQFIHHSNSFLFTASIRHKIFNPKGGVSQSLKSPLIDLPNQEEGVPHPLAQRRSERWQPAPKEVILRWIQGKTAICPKIPKIRLFVKNVKMGKLAPHRSENAIEAKNSKNMSRQERPKKRPKIPLICQNP